MWVLLKREAVSTMDESLRAGGDGVADEDAALMRLECCTGDDRTRKGKNIENS